MRFSLALSARLNPLGVARRERGWGNDGCTPSGPAQPRQSSRCCQHHWDERHVKGTSAAPQSSWATTTRSRAGAGTQNTLESTPGRSAGYSLYSSSKIKWLKFETTLIIQAALILLVLKYLFSGLDDPQTSLPTPAILWFCDSMLCFI